MFYNICMDLYGENVGKESPFNIENGNVDVEGGWNLCVCSESLKNR